MEFGIRFYIMWVILILAMYLTMFWFMGVPDPINTTIKHLVPIPLATMFSPTRGLVRTPDENTE